MDNLPKYIRIQIFIHHLQIPESMKCRLICKKWNSYFDQFFFFELSKYHFQVENDISLQSNWESFFIAHFTVPFFPEEKTNENFICTKYALSKTPGEWVFVINLFKVNFNLFKCKR